MTKILVDCKGLNCSEVFWAKNRTARFCPKCIKEHYRDYHRDYERTHQRGQRKGKKVCKTNTTFKTFSIKEIPPLKLQDLTDGKLERAINSILERNFK